MNRFTYEAVIEKSESGYTAYFPQIPDAFTQGKTRNETIENASDVLALVVGGLVDDGKPLPKFKRVVECVSISIVLTDEDIEALKYFSLCQAAEELDVSPARITQLITSGKLHAKYFGGTRMVSIASVNNYKKSPRKAGRPPKKIFIKNGSEQVL